MLRVRFVEILFDTVTQIRGRGRNVKVDLLLRGFSQLKSARDTRSVTNLEVRDFRMLSVEELCIEIVC